MKWATCEENPCSCTILIGDNRKQLLDCTQCKYIKMCVVIEPLFSGCLVLSLLWHALCFHLQWSPNATWWRPRCTEGVKAKAIVDLEESQTRTPSWTMMESTTPSVRTTASSGPSSATTQISAGVSTALGFVVLTRETKISSVTSLWKPSKCFILHFSPFSFDDWYFFFIYLFFLAIPDLSVQCWNAFFVLCFFSSWVRLQLVHKPVTGEVATANLKA